MKDILQKLSGDSLHGRLLRFSVVVLLLYFITLHEPFNLQVTETSFDILEGNGDVTVILLSDLHYIHLYPDHFQRVIDTVNSQNADLVLIAGDNADYLAGHWEKLRPLEGIRSRHGTYAVLGNHDYHSYNCDTDVLCADRMEQEFEMLGINVLRNEHVMLDIRGEEFALVGLDDLWAGRTDYPEAVGGIPGGTPKLILAHNQNAVIGKDLGENALVLSGHTHCGQVRIPLVTDLLLSSTGFSEVTGGRSTLDGTDIYVTCGANPDFVRFLAPPEISVIRLE
jgi:predicted MPP superfamily phosphohydrolase